MAQFGSALDWGSSGRRFKSCQPDKRKHHPTCIGGCFLLTGRLGGWGKSGANIAAEISGPLDRVGSNGPNVRMHSQAGDSGVGRADDLLEPVQLHTRVGNPGQAGAPECVATELLVPSFVTTSSQ